MTRIPENDREIIETALYLPMLLKILERDKVLIEQGSFKIKSPYVDIVENAIVTVRKDLKNAEDHLHKEKIKLAEIKRDADFTMYSFIYKGVEEHHNYFNPRLRNRTEELLRLYLQKDSTG
ncbi:hypothetical protein [Peribacillus loiseleuriae]|uniref:YhjD n=1 Tax=Peribacillus loiseleuriae TaxID=1679170 RepID=A0A0K9GRJ1_9BACI|nr:hypothetical protein [Peribacillus loiseleuriae]KMY49253.1 hypothetical protein AC625_06730 [Peribacillus loiseleuriae]